MIVTGYKIVSSDYARLDGVKKAVFLLETDRGVVNLECSVNCEVGSEAELTTRHPYGCETPTGTDAGISEQGKNGLFSNRRSNTENQPRCLTSQASHDRRGTSTTEIGG